MPNAGSHCVGLKFIFNFHRCHLRRRLLLVHTCTVASRLLNGQIVTMTLWDRMKVTQGKSSRVSSSHSSLCLMVYSSIDLPTQLVSSPTPRGITGSEQPAWIDEEVPAIIHFGGAAPLLFPNIHFDLWQTTRFQPTPLSLSLACQRIRSSSSSSSGTL